MSASDQCNCITYFCVHNVQVNHISSSTLCSACWLPETCFHAQQTRQRVFNTPAFTPRQEEHSNSASPSNSSSIRSPSPSLLQNQESHDIWSFNDPVIHNDQINIINQHIDEVHDLIQNELQDNQAPDFPPNYFGNEVEQSSSTSTFDYEPQSTTHPSEVPSTSQNQSDQQQSRVSTPPAVILLSDSDDNASSAPSPTLQDNTQTLGNQLAPLRETIQQELLQLRRVIFQHQQENSSSAGYDSENSIF